MARKKTYKTYSNPMEYYSRDKKLEKHRDDAVNMGLYKLSKKELIAWAKELAGFMGVKVNIRDKSSAMKFINDNYKR